MLRRRALLTEALTGCGLVGAPFVLPFLGFAPNTVNQILIWGLFGIGFDILFGFTGLLSFGHRHSMARAGSLPLICSSSLASQTSCLPLSSA
jgi:ABC-type branched-subunit amino acid transport system permease subunit